MRFGVCSGVETASLLAAAGYDYIELSVVNDLIPQEDGAAWDEKRRAIDAMPLRPETFNLFLRSDKIVGPDVDVPRLRRYAETAMTRASAVGGKVIVLGSGGARRVPEGFPWEQAALQLQEFLTFCADISDRTGVTIAIEPLNHHECNLINRVGEGAELARRIGRSGVRNLADTYHMEREGEALSAIIASADVLAHVHTADTDRLAPGTGSYDHVTFFRALRAAHYEDRLSIECNWQQNFAAQIGPSLAHLKTAYAQSAQH